MIEVRGPNIRVGIGFDVHPRDDERELWLGGVLFPGEAGLSGHSNGDAVCHALADALLGAAAIGDVGEHFPESDPEFEGVSGLEILTRTTALIGDTGSPVQCDLTVIADRPAIAPRRDEMRAAIAAALAVDSERVSVKGTRPEGLGLTGDGIGCIAVAVIG